MKGKKLENVFAKLILHNKVVWWIKEVCRIKECSSNSNSSYNNSNSSKCSSSCCNSSSYSNSR